MGNDEPPDLEGRLAKAKARAHQYMAVSPIPEVVRTVRGADLVDDEIGFAFVYLVQELTDASYCILTAGFPYNVDGEEDPVEIAVHQSEMPAGSDVELLVGIALRVLLNKRAGISRPRPWERWSYTVEQTRRLPLLFFEGPFCRISELSAALAEGTQPSRLLWAVPIPSRTMWALDHGDAATRDRIHREMDLDDEGTAYGTPPAMRPLSLTRAATNRDGA